MFPTVLEPDLECRLAVWDLEKQEQEAIVWCQVYSGSKRTGCGDVNEEGGRRCVAFQEHKDEQDFLQYSMIKEPLTKKRGGPSWTPRGQLLAVPELPEPELPRVIRYASPQPRVASKPPLFPIFCLTLPVSPRDFELAILLSSQSTRSDVCIVV